MTEAMKQSTKSFSDTAEELSSVLEVMAGWISKSIEKLAEATCFQAPIPVNRNMF